MHGKQDSGATPSRMSRPRRPRISSRHPASAIGTTTSAAMPSAGRRWQGRERPARAQGRSGWRRRRPARTPSGEHEVGARVPARCRAAAFHWPSQRILPQQAQEAVQERERMRRAPGDEEVDVEHGRGAAAHLVRAGEGTAGDRAGAGGDDDLRIRHRLLGLLQGSAHVLRHRAGDQQAVGVPRGGDKLDAESAHVPSDRGEDVRVRLAGVAAACAHLAKLQGPSQQPAGAPCRAPSARRSSPSPTTRSSRRRVASR